MNPLIITHYSNTDHRREVITLWTTVFGYESAHNRPEIAIDKKLAVADQLFFVALAEGRVVGTVMAGYDGHRGWIYSVAVSPAHRRHGIGSQLIRYAEQALAECGCMKINLQIMPENESVIAFYAALGFAVEQRINMGKKIEKNIPAA
jgi:ribosomal protein S18 acetylase RimI-like enzyme